MRDPRLQERYGQQDLTPPSTLESARRAAEAIAAGPPGIAAFEAGIAALQGHAGDLRSAFEDAFVERARRDPATARAWVEAFSVPAQSVIDTPETVALSMNDAPTIRALAQARRDLSHPFDVWRDPWLRRHDVRYRSIAAFQCLGLSLRIDASEALRAIERLPTLDMIELCFHRARADRDLIQDIVAAAPPVFGPDGEWLPERNVVALFAIEQIVAHAAALDESLGQRIWEHRSTTAAPEASEDLVAAEAERARARKEELPEWMRRAFGLVLARPDGRELALGRCSERGCRGCSGPRTSSAPTHPPSKSGWPSSRGWKSCSSAETMRFRWPSVTRNRSST